MRFDSILSWISIKCNLPAFLFPSFLLSFLLFSYSFFRTNGGRSVERVFPTALRSHWLHRCFHQLPVSKKIRFFCRLLLLMGYSLYFLCCFLLSRRSGQNIVSMNVGSQLKPFKWQSFPTRYFFWFSLIFLPLNEVRNDTFPFKSTLNHLSLFLLQVGTVWRFP